MSLYINTKMPLNYSAVKEDHLNTTLSNVNCCGHYSFKYHQPQRKERYLKCHRTTHRTADCNEKQKPNINKTANTPKPTVDLSRLLRVLVRSDCEFILKRFAGGEYSSTKKLEYHWKLMVICLQRNCFWLRTILI